MAEGDYGNIYFLPHLIIIWFLKLYLFSHDLYITVSKTFKFVVKFKKRKRISFFFFKTTFLFFLFLQNLACILKTSKLDNKTKVEVAFIILILGKPKGYQMGLSTFICVF